MSAAFKELDEVSAEAKEFLHHFKSLQLGTSDEKGNAVASYAPFALDQNGSFIIYVSELSAHTKNIQRGEPISVMLIEAEQDAEHIFARKRLTFLCEIEEIHRSTEEFDKVMDVMQEKFGDFISFMKKMEDFHTFRLHPTHANYVRGFAQAYEFQNADFAKIRHINDKGHKNGSRNN